MFTNKHYILTIFEDNTKNLIQKPSLGTLDIIIDNAVMNNETIKSTVWTTERLLLAVPREFPVNEKLKKFRLSAKDIKSSMAIFT